MQCFVCLLSQGCFNIFFLAGYSANLRNMSGLNQLNTWLHSPGYREQLITSNDVSGHYFCPYFPPLIFSTTIISHGRVAWIKNIFCEKYLQHPYYFSKLIPDFLFRGSKIRRQYSITYFVEIIMVQVLGSKYQRQLFCSQCLTVYCFINFHYWSTCMPMKKVLFQ